jgi:hypothetical protein
MNAGGIDRVLADGRATLNRAVKWEELSKAPHIFQIQTAEDKRSRDPMGRPIVPMEWLDCLTLRSPGTSSHICFSLVTPWRGRVPFWTFGECSLMRHTPADRSQSARPTAEQEVSANPRGDPDIAAVAQNCH